jgi:hypothetical protein
MQMNGHTDRRRHREREAACDLAGGDEAADIRAEGFMAGLHVPRLSPMTALVRRYPGNIKGID